VILTLRFVIGAFFVHCLAVELRFGRGWHRAGNGEVDFAENTADIAAQIPHQINAGRGTAASRRTDLVALDIGFELRLTAGFAEFRFKIAVRGANGLRARFDGFAGRGVSATFLDKTDELAFVGAGAGTTAHRFTIFTVIRGAASGVATIKLRHRERTLLSWC
jgi:hypothetical protein